MAAGAEQAAKQQFLLQVETLTAQNKQLEEQVLSGPPSVQVGDSVPRWVGRPPMEFWRGVPSSKAHQASTARVRCGNVHRKGRQGKAFQCTPEARAT